MGENIAIRDAYGAALKELGEQNEKIVGLEADVASSTKSGIFGKAFPERYFNVGISELDMVSMSAGFAREGLIPYVNTFAVSGPPLPPRIFLSGRERCGGFCCGGAGVLPSRKKTVRGLSFFIYGR